LNSDNGLVASPPASTKTSLGQKLRERARQRWPQLAGIGVRFRGQFAYVTGKLPDGSELPLCRLRYVGYASTWGFAIYRASHDDYQDNYLPSGQPSGTPEEALDCACGLYLGDPTAWLTPPGTDTPTDLQAGALVEEGCFEPPSPGTLMRDRSSRRAAVSSALISISFVNMSRPPGNRGQEESMMNQATPTTKMSARTTRATSPTPMSITATASIMASYRD